MSFVFSLKEIKRERKPSISYKLDYIFKKFKDKNRGYVKGIVICTSLAGTLPETEGLGLVYPVGGTPVTVYYAPTGAGIFATEEVPVVVVITPVSGLVISAFQETTSGALLV